MLNCREHNLWKAFVDLLFDNDEKVASSYKYTNIKVREQKPYSIYDQTGRNQLNLIPYLWQTQQKNQTFWGCTYIADIREHSPRPRLPQRSILPETLIHGARMFPHCFPISHNGNIASSVSFLFSRCKLCLCYTAGNFNENPSKRALAKICEQEQASTHLLFASNSSKGQILRALSNWMGPFDTPITQLQAKLDSTQSCYCASTAHDLPVISARGVRR